jgi:hypothetical protein
MLFGVSAGLKFEQRATGIAHCHLLPSFRHASSASGKPDAASQSLLEAARTCRTRHRDSRFQIKTKLSAKDARARRCLLIEQ